MSHPIRVLFVCTANICRSPFMEIYARSVGGSDLDVSSAGTHGLDRQVMSPEMAVELTSRGRTAEGFQSRLVTATLLDAADLVLCAERTHRQLVLDDHPHHFRKVFTLGQAVAAARSIPPDVTGRALLEELAQRRVTADTVGDIADPYRRGAAAAAAAAESITGMLDEILPRLGGGGADDRKRTHG